LVEGVGSIMHVSRTGLILALPIVTAMAIGDVRAYGAAAYPHPAAAEEPKSENKAPAAAGERWVIPAIAADSYPPSDGSDNEKKAAAVKGLKPVEPYHLVKENLVTVWYRGKSYDLTGQTAIVVRKAGLGLLRSACRERSVANDPQAEERYVSVRQRSYVLI